MGPFCFSAPGVHDECSCTFPLACRRGGTNWVGSDCDNVGCHVGDVRPKTNWQLCSPLFITTNISYASQSGQSVTLCKRWPGDPSLCGESCNVLHLVGSRPSVMDQGTESYASLFQWLISVNLGMNSQLEWYAILVIVVRCQMWYQQSRVSSQSLLSLGPWTAFSLIIWISHQNEIWLCHLCR